MGPKMTHDVEIEIPDFLKHLSTWHGYPIPYTTLILQDGTPDFRVVDEAKRRNCIDKKLCGVCGEKLKRRIAFIGGPWSIENRTFIDPAMHLLCARFAAKTCPYLAGDKRQYATTPGKAEKEGSAKLTKLDQPRPERMAICVSEGYEQFLCVDEKHGTAQILIKSQKLKYIDWNAMPPSRCNDESKAENISTS